MRFNAANSFVWKWILMSTASLLLLFPHLHLGVTTDPDGSLAWVMNLIPSLWPSAPGPFVFPHGPLVFLIHPLNLGLNLWMALAYFAVARSVACWVFLKRWQEIRSEGWQKQGVTTLAFLALLFMVPMQFMPYFVLLIIALQHMNSPHRSWLWLLVGFTSVAVLIKTNIALYAILTLLAVGLFEVYHRRFTRAMTLAVGSFIGAAVFWSLVYGPAGLSQLYPFIKGNFHLIFGNEAAMTLAADQWWWIGAGLMLLLLAGLLSKPIQRHWFWVAVLPVLLLGWKHGMVRHDLFHAWALFLHLIMALMLLVFWGRNRAWLTSIVSMLTLLAFFMAFSGALSNFQDRGWVRNSPLGWATLSTKQKLNTAPWMLSESINEGRCWDVYPYDYSYARFNDWELCPKPVVQAYAANTPYLDRLNATHFALHGPDLLLWHAGSNGQFTSIDGRYSWSDAPATTAAVLKHYQHIHSEANALVFAKRTNALNVADTVVSDSFNAGVGEWYDFASNETDWYAADFEVRFKSGKPSIISGVHRGKPIFINLKTKAGDERVFRLNATSNIRMASLSPLLEMFDETTLIASTVDSFRLLYDTNWYEAQFESRVYQAKGLDLMSKVLTVEVPANDLGPERIAPGGFSHSSTVETGDLAKGKYRVWVVAHMESEVLPNAQLVLEVIRDGKQVSDRAYINTPLTGGSEYFAGLRMNLDVADVSEVEIKAYLWNAHSKESISLKNMRIGVQKINEIRGCE